MLDIDEKERELGESRHRHTPRQSEPVESTLSWVEHELTCPGEGPEGLGIRISTLDAEVQNAKASAKSLG